MVYALLSFQCVMSEIFYDTCFQWAEQSKLLQRDQERNNNEGGVGCLGVQASLLDPKLMSKEPKHRHAFMNLMVYVKLFSFA
jgi:hypothetical protein